MEESCQLLSHELISALLDNPYEHVIVIDAEGIVRFMSTASEGVYPVSPTQAIGRHVRDVSPDSQLTRILATGKAEIGRIMALGEGNRIIARIPLKRHGRVIGAVGKLLFHDPDKIKRLYSRIETLEKNLDFYKEELDQVFGIQYSFEEIIGESSPIREAKAQARQAAESDSPVIILGESGTGKELFSHAIHQASKRHRQNFVRVNCAAIPNDLIEAEMFGYEPGAFTGANPKGKPGKFELADKGTIFLDEIGDMPLNMQVKLMRVLQDKEVERIGGEKPRHIDFRTISATNQDLDQLISQGAFRLDLYYRLNVIVLKLPALRDIRDDIPLIFSHIIGNLKSGDKGFKLTVSPGAMTALQQYHWPGNIRELRNVAERAMIVCQGGRIEREDLPISFQNINKAMPQAALLKSIVDEAERKAIVQALEQTGNNKRKASQILGIHRTGLYQKMKKHGLPV